MTAPLRWTVVVPVKGTAAGKSRLAPERDEAERMRLMAAFALDAVGALRAAPSVARVIVVTDAESPLAAELAALGADILPDPAAGLNAAVAAGLAAAVPLDHASTLSAAPPAADPSTAVTTAGLAAMLGDLPCLTAADLEAALALAAAHPLALVPDAEGIGSTLITARPGHTLVPSFGADSAARHRAAGHVTLPIPPTSTLRLDVDTPADLARAAARGLGPHSTAAVDGAPSA